jgi:uncharacterized phage-associated protein
MLHVWDVGEFFLRETGRPIDAMKLEKLCYYTLAWSLAWDRGEIFPERFQAWESGPVVRELFQRHKGQYLVSTVNGDALKIAENRLDRATATDVLGFYGKFTGAQLSEMTHREDPWRLTRERAGCQPGDYCDVEIDNGIIRQFYSERWQRARADANSVVSAV